MNKSNAIAMAFMVLVSNPIAAADLEQFATGAFPGDAFGSSVAGNSNPGLVGAEETTQGTGSVGITAEAAQAPPIQLLNDRWSLLRATAEASSPDTTAWRRADFDDSSWITTQLDENLLVLITSGASSNSISVSADVNAIATDVFVSEPVAFVGTSSGLTVIDVAVPSSPRIVKELRTVSAVLCVFVAEPYAYLGIGTGLIILDISDPFDPQPVTVLTDGLDGFNTLQTVNSVVVANNVAYATSQTENALNIIDVSDPAHPRLLDSLVDDTPPFDKLDSPYSVFVSGELAYVAADDAITVIDVSNPAVPLKVHEEPDGEVAQLRVGTSVFVTGTTAFVTAWYDDALTILDFSSISDPTPTARWLAGVPIVRPLEVVVDGTTAYVAGPLGLTILDVSRPDQPRITAQSPGNWTDVFVSNRAVYLLSNQRLDLIDETQRPQSAFLRNKFEIQGPFSPMQLNLALTHGCVVWMNGIEVARLNAPEGELAFDARALSLLQEPLEWSLALTPLSDFLVEGTNIIAIHALDAGRIASNISLNASLQPLDQTPPGIAEVSQKEPLRIEVVFDEPVLNVDASDLLVNGQPATAVVQLDGSRFQFVIANDPDDLPLITWSPDHGITDLSPSPNLFTGDSRILLRAPHVIAIVPAPSAILLDPLPEIEVSFNTPVRGVHAEDLLVNGVPASGLSTSDGISYVFVFDQFPEGTVAVSWSPDPGITLPGNDDLVFVPPLPWDYQVDQSPTLIDIFLVPPAALSGIAQVEVVFDERVTNLDASDLLLNDQPATAVSTLPDNRFRFEFPLNTTDDLVIRWSPDHGITDLSPIPNAFQEGAPLNESGPRVIGITPAPSAILLDPLPEIAVLFNKRVSGVHTNDLLVNGVAARSVRTSDETAYVFQFDSFPAGRLSVDWSPEAGITGQVPVASPSVLTQPWTYEVDYSPTVINISPAPGSLLPDLNGIVVQFSEPVAGAMAEDLLINGSPANAIIHPRPDTYSFTFPSPPQGRVRMEWRDPNQIVDTDYSPSPARLNEAWSYTVDLVASRPFINEINPKGSDWIEIHNPSGVDIDLAGWHLQDSGTRWTFPQGEAVEIEPGGYLVVAADGGNVSPSLDTNFKLNGSGEYLGLIMPDGVTIASEFFPSYPDLPDGISSYGRMPGTILNAFFPQSTRGGPNQNGILDVSAISVPSDVEAYLKVTEVMFDARRPPSDILIDKTEFDFVEFKNTGSATLDLTGVNILRGIDFTFSAGVTLAPGEYIVVVKNLLAFTSRYGTGVRVAGEYDKSLDNDGEKMELGYVNSFLEIEVRQDWYERDEGFSLVAVDESAARERWDEREQWRPSARIHGSPGRDDVELTPVVVNEALTFSALPFQDAIELFNPSTNDADISYWFLTDKFSKPDKFQFPLSTIIPAGGFLALDAQLFGQQSVLFGDGFSFDAQGEQIYLFSADATGDLTGYVHGFDFEASDANVPFGRHVTSTGEEHFVAQTAMTFFEPNAGPRVGPVVISEIMYHPVDPIDGSDNRDLEYIELRNITDRPLELFEAEHPTNGWRVDKAVEFELPPNTVLPPMGTLLLVRFDPSADLLALSQFKTAYGLSDQTAMVGPYDGRLNNGQETVDLLKPRTNVNNDTNETTALILMDRVSYTDSHPWPAGADGGGHSLQRIDVTAYGNDPANWTSGTPTPGASYPGGPRPTITEHPADQVVSPGDSAIFQVTVNWTGLLRYQWRLNGANIDHATNETLVINQARRAVEGRYDVIVFTDFHSVASASAELRLADALATELPVISLHPQDVAALEFETVTLSAAATGSILGYQWAHNDEGIPGATNATLTLTNLVSSQAGTYRVVVFNALGGVSSSNALVTFLLPPVVVNQPQDLTLLTGATATLRVLAIGTPPVTYQWRKNGTVIPGATQSVLIIDNAQVSDTGDYDAVVSNSLGQATSRSARLTILVAFPPGITEQPRDLSVFLTDPATFRVLATDTLPLTYQWRQNGVILPGATQAVYTIQNVLASDEGLYDVIVSTPAAQTISDSAFLAVLSVPLIHRQPSDVNLRPGSTATFSVDAVGSSSIAYQWRRNGVSIPGATQSTFTINAVEPADTGAYDVIVSDVAGFTISETAVLTVLVELTVIAPLPNRTITITNYVGGSFTLAVTVTNTATLPIGYRWGRSISTVAHHVTGQRTDLLTFSDLQLTNTGAYYCRVTNAATTALGHDSGVIHLVVEPRVDSDGDGLPDTYETANHLDKDDPNDGQPGADSDGDGSSNREEFIAGTDPQDDQSYLKIEQLERGPTRIRFIAQPGKTYAIHYRDNAASGQYYFLESLIARTPPAHLVEIIDADAPSDGSRYYRLVTPGVVGQ